MCDGCKRGCRTRRSTCQPQRSEESLEERHGAVSMLPGIWFLSMLEIPKSLYVDISTCSIPVVETFQMSVGIVVDDKTIHRISPGTWALMCLGLWLNVEVVKRLLYLARRQGRAKTRCMPPPAGTGDLEEIVPPNPPSIGGILHSRHLRRLSKDIQSWRRD